MPLTAIIDCGSGNLRSVQKALERAAFERGVTTEVRITRDPADVRAAARIVLPGVGAFGDCLKGLEAVPGLRAGLEDTVMGWRIPFLGICVGMQLMAEQGLEHGEHKGFGWIKGTVAPIAPKSGDTPLPIPHMGWNDLIIAQPEHPLWEGITSGDHAYFVHSYALEGGAPSELAATADYSAPLVAAVARDNLFGVQFHPEKSQALGLTLLGNFLDWRP